MGKLLQANQYTTQHSQLTHVKRECALRTQPGGDRACYPSYHPNRRVGPPCRDVQDESPLEKGRTGLVRLLPLRMGPREGVQEGSGLWSAILTQGTLVLTHIRVCTHMYRYMFSADGTYRSLTRHPSFEPHGPSSVGLGLWNRGWVSSVESQVAAGLVTLNPDKKFLLN